jgi:hypothetical protein
LDIVDVIEDNDLPFSTAVDAEEKRYFSAVNAHGLIGG